MSSQNHKNAEKREWISENLTKKKVTSALLYEPASDQLKFIDEPETNRSRMEMSQTEPVLSEQHKAGLRVNKFEELYNLSPSGFITLSQVGEIKMLNASTEEMLGKDRIFLENYDFGLLVTEDTREIMKDFLRKVFKRNSKQTCEVTLETGSARMYVKIEGILNSSGDECFATIVDISERKKYEENLRHFIRTLKAMQTSNLVVAQATNEKKLLNDVCRIIVEDCGYKMVWIGFKQNNPEKSVRPVAHAGFEEHYIESLKITWADTARGKGPTGTALRTGKTTLCRNLRTDPIFQPWRAEAIARGYSSSIGLPIYIDEEVFGVLTIYSKETDPFSADEQQLLSQLANILGYGLRAVRLNLALKKANETLEVKVKQRTSLLSITLHDLDTERQRVLDVINLIPAFVALIKPDYGILFSNRIYNELFGEPHDKKCYDHLFGRSEICEGCKIKQVLTNHDPCVIEWEGPNDRIYEKSNFLFKDKDGSYLVLEMGVDITEKKNHEHLMISKILETEERDRRRFARDLHDDLGPTLSAIRLQMCILATEQEDIKRDELFNTCDELLSDSIDKIRILANNIVPNLLKNYGLKSAVQSFLYKMGKSCRIKFKFNSDLSDSRFKQETELQLYRIITELVNNTIKHSGASFFELNITMNSEDLNIVYYDNGKGYDVDQLDLETSGMGLQNIRNRVNLVNGTLTFRRKGRKTIVIIRKPIADHEISLNATA
jgi:PAS domain S-box-containing protein